MNATEVAAILRKLADDLDAGKYKTCGFTDTVESVPAGTHKGHTVNVTTGRRTIALELRSLKHRPMELAMLTELAEMAWRESGGEGRVRALAEAMGVG